MPFISNINDQIYAEGIWEGILGMSPEDESAGPLLMDYLFEGQGMTPMDRNTFSILQTPN